MVSKLDKHEWDEDCSYCMANPWLRETKQVADLLPKLIDEEQAIKILQKAFLVETLESIENTQIKEYSYSLLDSRL